MPHKTAPEMDEAIAAYRRFNRFYTRIIGLLGDRAAEGRPLAR